MQHAKCLLARSVLTLESELLVQGHVFWGLSNIGFLRELVKRYLRHAGSWCLNFRTYLRAV